MRYEISEYKVGGTAVQAYTEEGEPYATCSVCLAEYGFIPDEGEIVVPSYHFTEDVLEQILSDICDEVIAEITYGPFDSRGLWIRLKKNI